MNEYAQGGEPYLGELELKIQSYDFFRKVPKDTLLNRIRFNRIAKSKHRRSPEAYGSWKEIAKILKAGGIPVKWERTIDMFISGISFSAREELMRFVEKELTSLKEY